MVQLVQDLFANTKDVSLGPFAPELALCATIVLMLLVRIPNALRRLDPFWLALAGSCVSLAMVVPWEQLRQTQSLVGLLETIPRTEIFTGMLVHDPLGVFVRGLLLVFAVLFILFTKLSKFPHRNDGTDFYALFLGSTLGMCLMASANHMLMVFMAVEMASVPSYVLAGSLRKPRSSEAALKYAVYGAGAAGVMVYGISLLAGVLNSAHLPTMASQLAALVHSGSLGGGESMVLALGGLMVMVGLAFKLSAVPFHFWCPDVFEGAPAEVGAFLSIASKGAALALLIRVTMGLGAVQESPQQSDNSAPPNVVNTTDVSAAGGLMNIADEREELLAQAETPEDPPADSDDPREAQPTPPVPADAGDSTDQPASDSSDTTDPPAEESDQATESSAGAATEDAPSTNGQAGASTDLATVAAPAPLAKDEADAALSSVRTFMAMLIALLAAITCTFGNLAAYTQTNIKRLLAYSTIAHAGYMMMAVPPALMLVGLDSAGAQRAVGALMLYVLIYLFMNMVAFAVVAFLRNRMQSEEIADYAGLVRQCPGVVVCLGAALFSLVGLPPLAGFIGKFAIFASLAEGYQVTANSGAAATFLIALLIIGGVNTAISLFYYLRVVKVMTIDPEPESRPPLEFSLASLPGAFLVLITVPLLVLIVNWNTINELTRAAAGHLF